MQTCDWDIVVFFYYMPFLPRGNLHLEGSSESADKLHAKAARFYSLLDSSDTSKSRSIVGPALSISTSPRQPGPIMGQIVAS